MSEGETNETRAERTARRGLRIDAIASGFVGALALAVSTYNVYLQREQIRAQVWPHVEWTYSSHFSAADNHFSMDATNTGVGPALIERVTVSVDGKPAKTWKEVFDLAKASDPDLRRLADTPDAVADSGTSEIHGRVLGAGVVLHALEMKGVKPGFEAALVHFFGRVKVEICYCSTLGECWSRGEPVRACAPGAADFED